MVDVAVVIAGVVMWRGRTAWRSLRRGAVWLWRQATRRRALIPIGVLLIVAIVLVLPKVMVPEDVSTSAERLTELRNSVRATLLQAVGGVLLVLGVVATWRELHINRESQITDRYTRAVDQLGEVTLDVQLGGLYALERIAHDSLAD